MQGVAAGGGVELLAAWFAGRAFSKHRHDSYAVAITDAGLQEFDYRGATRRSAPGQVVVLHPDEPHDGRAGTDAGFGYRILYLDPRRVAEALRASAGAALPLPFVAEVVSHNPSLSQAVDEAFLGFPAPPEPLALDAIFESLSRALLEADPSLARRRRAAANDERAIDRARAFLDAECGRPVASAELEAITGHDRFSFTRQFRRLCGTSPYRYLLLRRLDHARSRILAGLPLAQVALDTGFADQAHMSRLFRGAYGLSPARFRTLVRGSAVFRPGSAQPTQPG